MRWRLDQMPLSIHLPRPPEDMFEDADAVFDVVRDGITDWEDVGADGVPSFEFVEDAESAEVAFYWLPQATSNWIGKANYGVRPGRLQFKVDQVFVTARYVDGSPAPLSNLYHTVLHEMGHALGMMGHSTEPGDIMYSTIGPAQDGLTDRDRNTLRLLYRLSIGRRVGGARECGL